MKGIGIQVRQATAATVAMAGKAGQARQWYGQMDGQMDECYQGHIQPGRLCEGTQA